MFKLFAMSGSPAAKQAADRAQARVTAKNESAPAAQATGWARTNEAARPQTLSDSTQVWADRLEGGLYPAELMARYPRVANRLALCWSDPVLTSRLFDSLLQDRRGGRKGFPIPVKDDLLRLCRHHNAHRVVATPTEPWALLATSDR